MKEKNINYINMSYDIYILKTINSMLTKEKENTNISKYFPNYVIVLYNLYLDRCTNLVRKYNEILLEDNNLNIFKKFLEEYRRNVQNFAKDLDKLLTMIAPNIEIKKIFENETSKFLFEVLFKRKEYIYMIDLEYNKQEKAIGEQIKKDKLVRERQRKIEKQKRRKNINKS